MKTNLVSIGVNIAQWERVSQSNVALLHLTFFSRVHLQCANLMHVSSTTCKLNTEDENGNAFDACKVNLPESVSFATSMCDLTFVFVLRINSVIGANESCDEENHLSLAAVLKLLRWRFSVGGVALKYCTISRQTSLIETSLVLSGKIIFSRKIKIISSENRFSSTDRRRFVLRRATI